MKSVLIAAAVFINAACGTCAETLPGVKAVKPERTGEFVTLSGTASEFTSPTLRNEPYGFVLTDAGGDKIRIETWPDIFKHVKERQQLQTTGTTVQVTAEVVEYKGKLELHVQDYEEVKIGAQQ